jgi:hypothetical protein
MAVERRTQQRGGQKPDFRQPRFQRLDQRTRGGQLGVEAGGKPAASIRDESGAVVQSEASPPLKMTHCHRIRKVEKSRTVDILLHDAKTPEANPAGHGLV